MVNTYLDWRRCDRGLYILGPFFGRKLEFETLDPVRRRTQAGKLIANCNDIPHLPLVSCAFRSKGRYGEWANGARTLIANFESRNVKRETPQLEETEKDIHVV